jgi:hypothetical protein
MDRVIVVMIPTFGKNALRDVIIDIIVIRRDGGGVDGGGEGEKEKERTSKRGKHDAGRGGEGPARVP